MPFTHTIKFHHNADRCQTPSAGAAHGRQPGARRSLQQGKMNSWRSWLSAKTGCSTVLVLPKTGMGLCGLSSRAAQPLHSPQQSAGGTRATHSQFKDMRSPYAKELRRPLSPPQREMCLPNYKLQHIETL